MSVSSTIGALLLYRDLNESKIMSQNENENYADVCVESGLVSSFLLYSAVYS